MFDKLKQLKNLQEALSKERIEVEESGIKVVINGRMEIRPIA